MLFRKKQKAVVDTDPAKIDAVLSRGVEECIGCDELRERMLRGEQLRIKLGIDPTSPNVHLGRTIPLLKLRDFQELGHQIVLIIGDFTGVIGDTSDKDAERPMLSADVIEENKRAYFDQVAKLLDMDSIEFRYNSEWLSDLGYREIGEQANLFSVSDFIARDNIKKRLDAGKRVSLREMLYPLMQGYDSVAVRADVELGGTDQRFNNLAGRTMQPHFGQKSQSIVLGPIINGIDGAKMSSSKGNVIAVTMDPADMYGKVMRMRDSEIKTYFDVCTRVPEEEIVNIMKGEPRDAKMALAKEIVRMYHGTDAAEEAERAFVDMFQKGVVPDEMPEITAPYIDNLIAASIVPSKKELNRLLAAGSVRNVETNEKLTEIPTPITNPVILKIGKRRFAKLIP